MTYEFEYMMHLLGASTFGHIVQNPKQEVDWDKLLRLAKEQTVFQNVIYALKQLPGSLFDTQKYSNEFREYRHIIASEFYYREAVHKLLNYLHNAKIPFAVLKGLGLSLLYAAPESRISGDLDIYVGEENEARAIETFREFGITVQARDPICQEAKCMHPSMGIIELHAFLFSEEDRKYWFAGAEEFNGISAPFSCVIDNNGRAIPLLSDQDNALFLSLHLIKHFIKEGITLRNIADIALFVQKRSEFFDMDIVWKRLKELKLDKIIQVALSSCVYYLSVEPTCFPGLELMDKKLVDEFLYDIERGGNLGFKEKKDRADSKKIYERHVYEARGYNSAQYIWKKKDRIIAMIRAVFKCKDKLIQSPCCRKSRLFFPVAWVQYVCHGFCKIARGKIRPFLISKEPSISSEAKARVALFKKLEIM